MVCDKDQNRVSFCEDWEFYKAPFGSERRVAYIVYPKNADSYEERTFALQDVTGKKKVSFASGQECKGHLLFTGNICIAGCYR